MNPYLANVLAAHIAFGIGLIVTAAWVCWPRQRGER